MTRWLLVTAALVLPVALAGGCARAAMDTTGYALIQSAEFDAPFLDTWQAAKAELRAMDLEIYTRDKRGVFVAFTPQGRALWLQPQRSKFTVTIESLRPGRTSVDVETVAQVYGVTLLTYPDWHERPAKDGELARAILDGIAVRLGSQPAASAAAGTQGDTVPPAEIDAEAITE